MWTTSLSVCVYVGVITAVSSVGADLIALPALIVQADNISFSSNDSEATETQHATCRIVTEKLVATASATVTRALKGVCASKDVDKNFAILRNEFKNQIEPVRSLLLKMEQQMNYLQKTLELGNEIEKDSVPQNLEDAFTIPRYSEINQHNYTVHVDLNENVVFSYFWKVDSIRNKIAIQDQQKVFYSPKFYINNGYRMHIKLFPNQNKGIMYIYVGLTQGLHDNLLEWPFTMKHRINILDQSVEAVEDIASRVWDPNTLCSPQDWQRPLKFRSDEECVGFGFSQTTILTRNYIFNDSILIKLDVFLF